MRAAVTGWAWRTPLGNSVDQAVARLLAGERAAGPSSRFGSEWTVAEIPGRPRPTRNTRFLRRMGLWAMEAGREAFDASGAPSGERLGLFTAVGAMRANWDELCPALERQSPCGTRAWESGFRLLHPLWMLQYMSNNVQALLAAEIGARGDGAAFGGAGSGALAVRSATRALALGSVDAAVVVAYDSLLEPETLAELDARGARARGGKDMLVAAYDTRARGGVPGEAAASIVLTREPAERCSLANVEVATVAGGEECEPSGATIARAAQLVAQGEGVVDGAARGTLSLDADERVALASVVGPEAALTATSSAFGQLGAASTVAQAIALAACLARGELPPVAGLRQAAAGPLRPLGAGERTRALSALAVATGAPGLASVLRVEVSR